MKFTLTLLTLCCLAQVALADYIPSLGRFCQRDPIEESGGVNLYAFAENKSLNAYDRLGLLNGPYDTEEQAVAYASIELGDLVSVSTENGYIEYIESGKNLHHTVARDSKGKTIWENGKAVLPPEDYGHGNDWAGVAWREKNSRFTQRIIILGTEYGTAVHCNAQDGKFYYPEPIKGNIMTEIEIKEGYYGYVELDKAVEPYGRKGEGHTIVHLLHTHYFLLYQHTSKLENTERFVQHFIPLHTEEDKAYLLTRSGKFKENNPNMKSSIVDNWGVWHDTIVASELTSK